MLKILYEEKCLRYFLLLEIVTIIISCLDFHFGLLIIMTIVSDIFGNFFWNTPLLWFLFKITAMFFISENFKKIIKIENEEEKKSKKKKLKIITFILNLLGYIIFLTFFIMEMNEVLNAIASF